MLGLRDLITDARGTLTVDGVLSSGVWGFKVRVVGLLL